MILLLQGNMEETHKVKIKTLNVRLYDRCNFVTWHPNSDWKLLSRPPTTNKISKISFWKENMSFHWSKEIDKDVNQMFKLQPWLIPICLIFPQAQTYLTLRSWWRSWLLQTDWNDEPCQRHWQRVSDKQLLCVQTGTLKSQKLQLKVTHILVNMLVV